MRREPKIVPTPPKKSRPILRPTPLSLLGTQKMADPEASLFESLPASSCKLETLMSIWSSDSEAVVKRKHSETESDNDSDIVRRRRREPARSQGVFVLCLKGSWIDEHRQTLRSNSAASAAHHLWIPSQGNWLRKLELRPHRGDVIIVLNRDTHKIAAVTKALDDAECFIGSLPGAPVAFSAASNAEVVVRVEELRVQLLAPEKSAAALLSRLPKMHFRVGYARRLPDGFLLGEFLATLNNE